MEVTAALRMGTAETEALTRYDSGRTQMVAFMQLLETVTGDRSDITVKKLCPW